MASDILPQNPITTPIPTPNTDPPLTPRTAAHGSEIEKLKGKLENLEGKIGLLQARQEFHEKILKFVALGAVAAMTTQPDLRGIVVEIIKQIFH